MIMFYVLGWTVLTLLALLVLILLTPVRYSFQGCWQEKFSGDLLLGAGPFVGLMNWAATGSKSFSLKLADITLKEGPLNKGTGKRLKPDPKDSRNLKEHKDLEDRKDSKEPKNSRDSSWTEAFVFLDKDLIKAVIGTVGEILRYCAPEIMELKGGWGLSNPYYTGLMAAITSIFPSIQVEPDFTGERRDLKIRVQGRVRPITLLYFLLKLLVSRSARPVLKVLWHKSKIKNRLLQPFSKPGVLNI